MLVGTRTASRVTVVSVVLGTSSYGARDTDSLTSSSGAPRSTGASGRSCAGRRSRRSRSSSTAAARRSRSCRRQRQPDRADDANITMDDRAVPKEVAGPIRARPALRLPRGVRRRQADRGGADRVVQPPSGRRLPRNAPRTGSPGRSRSLACRAHPGRYGAGWRGGPARPPRREPPRLGAGGRMILTVTLNTAIDKTLAVPNFRLGRRHRAVEQTTMPGGKGVNVARVLKTLGRARDRDRARRRRDRHAPGRPAHAVLRAVRLRPDPRGVANEHGGDRPDDGRADRDQRARAERVRAGGRAVRRQAALPGAAAPRCACSRARSRATWTSASTPA